MQLSISHFTIGKKLKIIRFITNKNVRLIDPFVDDYQQIHITHTN